MRSPGRSRETKNPKYGRKAPARASVSETDKKFNLIKTITTMKYLIRSVKYFIALCVLYLIIMALMLLTNTSVLTPFGNLLGSRPLHTRAGADRRGGAPLGPVPPSSASSAGRRSAACARTANRSSMPSFRRASSRSGNPNTKWCSGQTPSSSGSRSFSKMKSESPRPGNGSRSKVFAGV